MGQALKEISISKLGTILSALAFMLNMYFDIFLLVT